MAAATRWQRSQGDLASRQCSVNLTAAASPPNEPSVSQAGDEDVTTWQDVAAHELGDADADGDDGDLLALTHGGAEVYGVSAGRPAVIEHVFVVENEAPRLPY